MSDIEKITDCMITLGSRWRTMIRASLSPAMRAASTYSRRLATRISALMMRVSETQPTIVIAKQVLLDRRVLRHQRCEHRQQHQRAQDRDAGHERRRAVPAARESTRLVIGESCSRIEGDRH